VSKSRYSIRWLRASLMGAVALLVAVAAMSSQALARTGASTFTPLPGSVTKTSDRATGTYHAPAMSVEVVLKASHGAALQRLLGNLYDAKSSEYQHWLSSGSFDRQFAPSRTERAAVIRYLRASGLSLKSSDSPFLVRATGSSATVSTAFRSDILTYRDRRGMSYFSNATAAELPAGIAHGVLGVLGLSNTVRLESSNTLKRVNNVMPNHSRGGSPSNCETPYPSVNTLIDLYVNNETLSFGYGAGPGCNGLTPSQTNSIYDAPDVGPRGKGEGVNLAVFELSAYQESDIDTWAHTFYGRGYNPPLENINVDGGPLNPRCPTGDTCPPTWNYYAGDIEVDADIENQLSVAPDARHIIVYNAPNDETGQTELDEYTAIAQQDTADSVSSSWGLCENDAGASYAEAENQVFEQMAAQGQSVFGSAGDTGAFDCIRDGTGNRVNVDDPSSQPWVTSVGGTTFDGFNPGQNANPSYPRGEEMVWNVDNLCNESADEYGQTGYFWCTASGAGGGGSSQFWGRPYYQQGPGVQNRDTVYGNGSTNCSLARVGTPCREVPDVSADADEFTGYAEYCTGSSATLYSVCATISSNAPGWFEIGGTSLSSPLWSAIIGDRDGYTGHRTGSASALLYAMFNQNDSRYFHDITGIDQFMNNNGLYPTTPFYDMATGIGTPIMSSIITGS